MKQIFITFILCICLFAQESAYIDSNQVRNPTLAWKLSFFPGLGQIYNGKYGKSLAFLIGEYYAIDKFIDYKNDGKIPMRNTYAWWIFGIYVLNILDSYVDAHLSTFPNKKLGYESINDSLNYIK